MTVHRGRNEAPSRLRRGRGLMRDGRTETPSVAFGQQVPANVATATGAGEQHT
jgi:hypothetical protein